MLKGTEPRRRCLGWMMPSALVTLKIESERFCGAH
jgi:hypothetical protein